MNRSMSLPRYALLLVTAAACLAGCTAPVRQAELAWVEGGIVRGPRDRKEIALVFTGGDFGEGTTAILDALQTGGRRASFFLTGGYLREPAHQGYVRRMLAEGHYVGPHSDAHLLYCAWEDRSRTLVSESEFKLDLEKNIAALERLGAARDAMRFFVPPFEWYNAEVARWAQGMGVTLINFTPGTRSHADWAPDDHRAFMPSRAIARNILDYESTQPGGLNGFLLLLHLGSSTARSDKMHLVIPELLDELTRRGYRFVRVDEMLPATSRP